LFGSNASIACTTLLSSSTQADGGVPSLVLAGATLLDGSVDPPKPNSMIIIQGDRIVSVTSEIGNNNKQQLMSFISSNNGGSAKANALVLNPTGKYVMPGLFDMHAHVAGIRKDT
jgi:imidazolonepropionase-like amidohydrolase